jgi:serine protease Do
MNNGEYNNNEVKNEYVEANYTTDSGSQDIKYDFNANYNKNKKNRKGTIKVVSGILGVVMLLGIGGVGTFVGTMYVLPKTAFFKSTPLYNELSQQISQQAAQSYHATQLKDTEGGLTVPQIASKVGSAVVGVATKSVAGYDFFGNSKVQEGIGSGVIINDTGYVLTNNHVIEGAQTVKVILSNGKEVSAKVMNADPNYDIAIVKITDDIQMPAVAELGDSNSLVVGEDVVAIGNPLGKEFLGSVTKGIVSAVNRQLEANSDIKYIQTNAAINAGNSGGPLLNSKGQVIGINTAKINSSGVEGMGFAIPIDIIKDKIPNLSKPVLRVGISGKEITQDIQKANKKMDTPLGVYVVDVQEFSPAEKAKLKAGDIITKFAGKDVKTIADINSIKTQYNAGDTVKVEIKRLGDDNKYSQTLTLDLTLIE